MCYFYPPKEGANGPSTSTPTFIDRAKGALMHLLFISCWVGGVNVPFIILLCLWWGSALTYSVCLILLFVAIYPFLAKPGKWSSFKHAIPEWGQRYHQECNIIFEDRDVAKDPYNLKKHAICFHPHGILSWGFVLNAGFRSFFEPIFGVVAEALCYAPIWYWFITCWTDAVRPASKKYLLKYMKAGESFGIIPGGFEEATITKLGKHRVYLKKRKGFVKYALQHGYALVPVYTFGESDTYSNLQGLFGLRLWLNKFQLPAVVPFGAWWCPILPKPARINTVFGKPLQLPKIENPTKDEINKYHQQYIEALFGVFERNKEKVGYPDAELELW